MESFAESYRVGIAAITRAGEKDLAASVAVLVSCDLDRCDGFWVCGDEALCADVAMPFGCVLWGEFYAIA